MFRSRNKDAINGIITIHGRTKYSLIEEDLDSHQTEIDFKKSIGHTVCYLQDLLHSTQSSRFKRVV